MEPKGEKGLVNTIIIFKNITGVATAKSKNRLEKAKCRRMIPVQIEAARSERREKQVREEEGRKRERRLRGL